MSGNNPIKIVSIIAVIVGVIIAVVAISRINGKSEPEPESSVTYVETTRGSYSGSLSSGSTTIGTTVLESEPTTEETTASSTYVAQTYPKTTETNKATVSNSAPVANSLSVVSKPTKTEYFIGDNFSSSGLKVKVNYSNGTTKDVTNLVNIVSPDMYKSGSQSVKISYTENGKKVETSFKINISTPSISISSTEEVMYVGEYLYLSATTAPSNRTVSWTSSANDIVTVSSSGKVSALKEGIASITASFQYGSEKYSETCLIMVKTDEPKSSSLSVYFYDGTYENDEYSLYLYDLEGTVSSNYTIEYVEIGIIGPVYVNGKLQELDQSQTYTKVYELNTTNITLEELARIYGDGFEFDIVAGEEYCVYVYAEDSSGETAIDYYEVVFDVEEI